MKTVRLEINCEMKDVLVFESMWEYLEYFGATVEDYVLSPHENEGEKIVDSFKPIEDTNFGTFSSDMVEIEGEYYQHVNWGENEYSMIPEASLEAEFWLVYEWNVKLSGYDTRGQIFQTEEEARKEVA